MYKNKCVNVKSKVPFVHINTNSFIEYFDLYDGKVANKISEIFYCIVSDIINLNITSVVVVEYDGVNLVLITDSETLNECEKRDYFFRRDLSYILKKYSKMLLPYNKNYNEEDDI